MIEAGKRGKASFTPKKKKGGRIFWRNAEGGRGTKLSDQGGDIQTVLDRLDNIEVSLEDKIDASIQSQEFTMEQLSDKIKSVETSTSQAHTKSDKLLISTCTN